MASSVMGMSEFVPMVAEGFDDLVERKTEFAGAQGHGLELVLGEVVKLGGGGLGDGGDAIPGPGNALDQSFVLQRVERLLDGVGIDAVFGRESADGRKDVTGLELA